MTELSNEEIIQKVQRKKDLAKARAKKFYNKNKETILKKQKLYNENLKVKYLEILKDEPVKQLEPIKQSIEPEPEPVNLSTKIKTDLTLNKTIELLNQLEYRSDRTKKNYINNIKTVFDITECNDLLKCLTYFNKIINYIDNAYTKTTGNKYSINSKKQYVQSIVFIIDHLPINISKPVRQKYLDYFNELKILSNEQTENNKLNQDLNVLPWNIYLENIDKVFGMNSKEYIISLLYKEVPVRDDFHLKIVDTSLGNFDENFIVIPKKANLTVIITNYKTDKKYGVLNFKLSKKLTGLIRDYIKTNNLIIGDYLFGKQETNTSFVSKMNSSIGLKGGINYYRKMTISALMKNNPSPQERVQQANLMMHSPVAQLKYIRVVKE